MGGQGIHGIGGQVNKSGEDYYDMHDCAGARHARGEVVYSNEIRRILPLRKSG